MSLPGGSRAATPVLTLTVQPLRETTLSKELLFQAPKLLKSMDGRRRSAVVLGCAFEADPALMDALLRYGTRDDKCLRALTICLGRYRGEAVQSFLAGVAEAQEREATP